MIILQQVMPESHVSILELEAARPRLLLMCPGDHGRTPLYYAALCKQFIIVFELPELSATDADHSANVATSDQRRHPRRGRCRSESDREAPVRAPPDCTPDRCPAGAPCLLLISPKPSEYAAKLH